MTSPSALAPWFSPTGTTTRDPRGVLPGDGQMPAASRTRFAASQNGPLMLPSDWSDEDVRQYVAGYDQYIAKLTDAWQQTTGLQRQQIESQIEDAKKGRENALEIAHLNDQTSRYGTDVASRDRLAALQQADEQFRANHGLEMQKFGLDVAEAYTKYASTPDLTFQRADLMEGLQRAGVGQGPSPYGSVGTPKAKSWEDWSALQGWATPTVQAGQTAASGGGPANVAAAQGAAGAGVKDPRLAAANGILKAIPPSDGTGHDDSDWAALSAIRSVYQAAKPGTMERLRPGQRAAVTSGLSRLGYYAPDALDRLKRAAPNQGGVRSA